MGEKAVKITSLEEESENIVLEEQELTDDSKLIKSSLHDASPSWNGYNYQGFIGIYVCLKIIKNQLDNISFDDLKTSDFLKKYTIEYEWLEDFSIKYNGKYQSLHQVKHKEGQAFSSHIDAINTILDRKRKIVNETDINKYLKYTEGKEKILGIFELLKSINCITSENIVIEDFDLDDLDKLSIDLNEIKKIKAFLMDFKKFSNNAFDESKVYFHTTEGISKPSKTIDKYKQINSFHKEILRNRQNLKHLKIYFEFDDEGSYKLKISDSEIENIILELIDDILRKKNIGKIELTLETKKLYFQGLFEIVVQHIRARHVAIRSKIYNDVMPYNMVIEGIKFEDFFNVLNKNLLEKNAQYWDYYCKYYFTKIFDEYVNDLESISSSNPSLKDKIDFFIGNLNDYFNKEIYSEDNSIFLKNLKKMACDNYLHSDEDDFYRNLLNKDRIKHPFFGLIREIEKKYKSFYFICKDDKRYLPTSIKLPDDDFIFKVELEKVKINILKNMDNNLIDLDNADFIVLDVKEENIIEVDSLPLRNMNIIDDIIDTNDDIVSDKMYAFLSLKSTKEKLSNDI